jgi:hypothetical protein
MPLCVLNRFQLDYKPIAGGKKMKPIFTLLMAISLLGTYETSQATRGADSSGGGGALVCFNDPTAAQYILDHHDGLIPSEFTTEEAIAFIEAYDLYYAKQGDGWLFDIGDRNTYLSYFLRFNPSFPAIWENMNKVLDAEMEIVEVEQPISFHDDLSDPILGEQARRVIDIVRDGKDYKCLLTTLVAQYSANGRSNLSFVDYYESEISDTVYYMVDSRLFKHPKHSKLSQDVLWVHENTYTLLRQYGQANSLNTKMLVKRFIQLGPLLAMADFRRELVGLGFPPAYYNEIPYYTSIEKLAAKFAYAVARDATDLAIRQRATLTSLDRLLRDLEEIWIEETDALIKSYQKLTRRGQADMRAIARGATTAFERDQRFSEFKARIDKACKGQIDFSACNYLLSGLSIETWLHISSLPSSYSAVVEELNLAEKRLKESIREAGKKELSSRKKLGEFDEIAKLIFSIEDGLGSSTRVEIESIFERAVEVATSVRASSESGRQVAINRLAEEMYKFIMKEIREKRLLGIFWVHQRSVVMPQLK